MTTISKIEAEGEMEMKETTIKVEKTVKYVTKEELVALGYKEISTGGMMKYYPTYKNYVGYAIFRKISEPGIKDAYWHDNGFLCLNYYEMGDDQKEFGKRMKKAIDKYSSDMIKLGLLEEKKEGGEQ